MRKVLAQFQKESDVSNKDHKLRVLRLAYDQAMQRINDQRLGHQRLAKHVLSWITHSERPLTPLELRHAWAVKDSEDELDEGSLPATDDLVAVCAGLVTIDDLSGIIRLVHYTTQEYFEQTRARWFPDAEYEMAMICAKYLMFRTFNGGICQTRKEYEELLASNPLFEYAATNCFRHAEKDSSGHGCDEVANLLRSRANYKAADQVSDVTMYQAMTGYEYDWFESPWQQGYTPEGLHLAANLGLKHVVQHFIRTDHPDTRDRWGLTPLCYAAESGHEDVVQVLLATRRVDVNANREGHGTPLILAISEGNEGVVNLLLATEYMEIDVNTEDELGDLPISAAARCPTKAIADALLATNRVDFTLRNRRGETALHLLAHAPDDIVVEIIQSPEIRSQVVEVVNWKDSLGCTALSIAVQKHRDRMVKALLAWGEVDVNARDKEGWTTLRHAYDGEYGPAGSSTVQLLIAHGAHE
jgi:ankyrin repeat protein